ncbi:hypothetical protein [Agaribacter flavus]|uniref:DUF4402 domain-containing protein n=1 Tax=Agaribacter flavus TaxID=1902781 RepID=A0ABV7FNF7_9ALTE
MFKRNHLYTAVVVGALATCSSLTMAQETVNSTATVIVQNAFTLAETTPIDFGTLRVTQGAAQTVTAGSATLTYVTIPGDGSPVTTQTGTTAGGSASTDGQTSSIVDGAPAEYAITGAAPFTALTISVGTGADEALTAAATNRITGMNDTNLVTPGGSASEFFTLYAAATDVYVVGGANDGDQYNATTPNLTTDTNGDVGFTVGGILAYNGAATASPRDGTYTGSYSITVSY